MCAQSFRNSLFCGDETSSFSSFCLFLKIFSCTKNSDSSGTTTTTTTTNNNNNTNNNMRRKNPHPQRAVNARTVLKVSSLDARAAEEEVEEEEPVLCLRIPDEDEVVFEIEQKEIRKEKTTTKRGKRKWTQRHECDVCEKMFGSQADLARHMRIHTNERPYECEVCEKRFTRADHLQTHMRIHTNEKPYECDVCDKAFHDSSNLKKHKRTHTNERPYECHVYEKRFTRAYNLTVHKRIHTNEKPYECDVCEKRFRQSSTLKRHMRTQH